MKRDEPTPDRDSALEGETQRIAELLPLFNVNKNPDPHPDPWGALRAAHAASLSPEARALREQDQDDPEGHVLAATELFLRPTAEALARTRAS